MKIDMFGKPFVLLASAAFALASAVPAVRAEEPIMRVGVVSDSQGFGYKEDWGFHNLERAFEALAKEGIDVLVNAGDIVDGATPDIFEGLVYVQELEKRHFGAHKPVDVACLGNHELGFSAGTDRSLADNNLKRFAEIYGHPASQLVHKVVKGFDFIAFSCYEPVGEPQSWKYIGNFYRYERNRDRRLCFKVPPNAMKTATRYRAKMFPVANFGTEGRPLTMDIKVRDNYGFRNDKRAVAYPQE